MATDEGYNDDTLAAGTYSQLLLGDDDNVVTLDSVQSLNFNSHSKMLCFGENRAWYDYQLVGNYSAGVVSADAASDESSPVSVDTNKDSTRLSKPNKRRNGSLVKESQMKKNSVNGVSGNQKNGKKAKAENPTFLGHAKTQVKKEKLGERITALQQIVSPFGKTDTASVLHEATGYIRFLHDQLQVLSSPYLHRLPTSAHLSEGAEKMEKEVEMRELRSRGLCLIPVELLTSHVSQSNGADFWSPAMVENVSSTSQ